MTEWRLYEQKLLWEQEFDEFFNKSLNKNQDNYNIQGINYKNGGLIIHTTIDSRIQNFLENSFNESILDSKVGLQNKFNNATPVNNVENGTL